MRATAVLACVSVLLATGCASAPEAPQAPAFVPLSVETAGYIRLSEGACFGNCPVYELTLYPTGQYVLMSQRFTEGENRSDNKPSESSFEEAKAILAAAGFEDLPDDITMDNPEACPMPATDHATAEITIGNAAGYYRTVRYYQGCFHDTAETMLRQLRSVMRVADLVRAAEPQDESDPAGN